MKIINLLILVCLLTNYNKAQIVSLDSLINVSTLASLPNTGNIPICLGKLPNGNLCYNDLDGNIFEIINSTPQALFTATDHHLPYVSHMEIKGENMYLCGSVVQRGDSAMIGYVMKGHIPSNNWDTLASSDPYYLGLSFNDHRFSSLTISPTENYIYVHSGSRTNAGEVHELPGVNGTLNLRDQPIRGKLFQLPTDSNETIHLYNDSNWIQSSEYLFAQGLRHLFALAIGTDGQLYGASNSDRRDVPEAFYKIIEGEHFGFPWWIGGEQNPLQQPTYDPNTDLLLPAGANNQGYYNTDLNFPIMPTGIDFVLPYKNIGPDADKYRDAQNGSIKDASDEKTSITSFSAHRSPVGLSFDRLNQLPNTFKGAGYMVSYSNNSNLLEDDGHDLLQLNLLPGDSMSVKKLISGFIKPIDALITDSLLYILEMGNYDGSERKIYVVNFRDTSTVSINEQKPKPYSKNYVQFSPNPTFGKVNISLQHNSPIKQIRIFDKTGKLHKTIIRPGSTIDIKDLKPQIYFLNTIFLDGRVLVKKLKKE